MSVILKVFSIQGEVKSYAKAVNVVEQQIPAREVGMVKSIS